jgi:nitrogen fixation/metabolism regulation signal transduction histidine kinase
VRKRVLFICGIVLLAISVALVVWQGSFNFGKYGPADPQQTFIFWAISSLIFVLMVTLGFMLVRTVVKLYIDRRSGREGSRIQTKLVLGALALSLTPALFLVLFSYQVLNRNLAFPALSATEAIGDNSYDLALIPAHALVRMVSVVLVPQATDRLAEGVRRSVRCQQPGRHSSRDHCEERTPYAQFSAPPGPSAQQRARRHQAPHRSP